MIINMPLIIKFSLQKFKNPPPKIQKKKIKNQVFFEMKQ